MKKILFFTAALLGVLNLSYSQIGTGLEGIIVDTLYIGNADDGADLDGASTYRVYIDMKSGYEFVSMYGQTEPASGKIDTLFFNTTTDFYNNTTAGGNFANNVNEALLGLAGFDVAYLDSYLTPGAATNSGLGVLKADDTDGSLFPAAGSTALQNTVRPITAQDGMIDGTPLTFVTPPGFDGQLTPSFNTANGVSFETSAGAVAMTDPLVGPTPDNLLLIGQFTTDGDFSFQMNISLRDASTGIAEEWVAKTPQPGQFTSAALQFPITNDAPTVSITAPVDGDTYSEGDPALTVTASAADADGTVAQVEFFDGSTSLGVDTDGSDGFSVMFTPQGPAVLTAVATDDFGDATTSAVVNVNYNGNAAPTVTLDAIPNTITGDDVTISATASDDVAVAQVEFFVGGTSIGVDTDGSDGYSVVYTTTMAGMFNVEATATDSGSATIKTGSDTGTLTVADNQAPTATITAPTAGSSVADGDTETVTASGADVDGSVASIEFFVNGTSIGVDADGSDGFSVMYTYDFATTDADVDFTAVATDDRGLVGTASAVVGVEILDPSGSPYLIMDVDTVDCSFDNICMPFGVNKNVSNIIGWDLEVTWDNSKVYPTGLITKLDDLLDPMLFETDHYIDFANNKMLISIFFNSSAPIGTYFDWANGPDFGGIICIDFAKRPGFLATDATDITVTYLDESYVDGVINVNNSIGAGTFATTRTEEFTGTLSFWADNSPIRGFAGVHLPTSITGTDNSCANPAAVSVEVDTFGFFTHDLNNGLSVQIDRDIPDTKDVQSVINGFDALQVRKMILNLLEVPNPFQIIAMDVNMDGRVSAGDASQINQRAVLQIGEYRQAWSHDAQGNKVTTDPTKDWLFLAQSVLEEDPQFQVSTNFPEDNGVGYSRFRVPTLPFCMPAPVENWETCPVVTTDDYVGILLGDINGNYKSLGADAELRSAEKLVVNLGGDISSENTIDVPVTFESTSDVYTLDLSMNYNLEAMKFVSVSPMVSGLQVTAYYNAQDNTLRITSNSLSVLPEGEIAMIITFEAMRDLDIKDVMDASGFINGDATDIEFIEESVTSTNGLETLDIVAYPNPTSGMLNVSVDTDVVADIYNMQGEKVVIGQKLIANTVTSLDLSTFNAGVYTLSLYNGEGVISKRIILTK